MRRRILLFLLPVVLAATALAQTVAMPGSRTKLGGSGPSERIARESLHELLMLPYYSVFDNLAFKVDGTTVTLLGQVVDPSLRSSAEAVVKKIEGVEKVVNDIEVLPVSPFDDRIRRAQYRAVFGGGGLYKYALGAVPSIHIIVKNGHVTLVGMVDNEGDRNLAEVQARGVPDVFSVTNRLQVAQARKK